MTDVREDKQRNEEERKSRLCKIGKLVDWIKEEREKGTEKDEKQKNEKERGTEQMKEDKIRQGKKQI